MAMHQKDLSMRKRKGLRRSSPRGGGGGVLTKASGQSAMEYMILVIIVMGALLTISNYFKRGLQGRWKAAVDDLGDQYDPRMTNTDITYSLVSNAETRITTVPVSGGIWTMRDDQTNAVESKTGTSRIGAGP